MGALGPDFAQIAPIGGIADQRLVALLQLAIERGAMAGARFEFAVERAVFIAALHRLFVSGSDRDCASWIEDYDIPGAEGLELHHFYRAMAWLGEELEETPGGAIRTAAPSRLFSTICT